MAKGFIMRKRNIIFIFLVFVISTFCSINVLAYSKSDIQNRMISILYGGQGGYVSCDFDGYVTTPGRHEGIDISCQNGAAVYALCEGKITNIERGFEGEGGLSTIAIYYGQFDKTVIYLHTNPLSSLSVGQNISKGEQIAMQSWRGVSYASSGHTHVEVRDGWATQAYKSVKDYILQNNDPYPFWESVLLGQPNYATLSTNKKSYAKDEPVYFTVRSDGDVNTLWIYCPNGDTLNYQNIGTSYELGFGMLGHFQALVETWNGEGSFQSERIDFVVGPPTYAALSSNKKLYARDEPVYFTVNADGNINTLWIYCPNGDTLNYQNIGTSYELGFGMLGHYQALVEAWNGEGSLQSERIDFVVGPPTYAALSINKKSYAIDEPVYFTIDADGNINTLWIYCPNGDTLNYQNIETTSYELGFGMPGHFQALVETWNGEGSFQSDRIDFVVGPPTYAAIVSDKATYSIGEEVTFTCNTDGDTNTIWIYYPDGTSQYFRDIDTGVTLTFDTEGNYEALVQAWNTVDSLISERIGFTVGNNQNNTIEWCVLPSDLQEIGEEAFSGTAIENIYLCDGVHVIGRRAFADSDVLLMIRIPESVTQIEKDAFKNSANVQIQGISGSQAEQYANETGINFIEE